MTESYLTSEIPGIGGSIKTVPEDFRVEEIAAYEPCGEGEHLFLLVEKKGITTLEALRRLAAHFGVPERDCGYAGLKDSVGVTLQYLSFPRVAKEKGDGLELPALRVLQAEQHRNKLKPGHLQGNRFKVIVRDLLPEAEVTAQRSIDELCRRGVPNLFGPQRYGAQGNSAIIGRCLAQGDFAAAVHALIGEPDLLTDQQWQEAVRAFQRGDLPKSLELMPRFCRSERSVIERLIRSPANYSGALKTVHPRLLQLYLSAAQSSLFDDVVRERLATGRLDKLLAGDIAVRHDNGACFRVQDPEAERERMACLAISPSGPMIGRDMLLPEGEPLALENRICAGAGISPNAPLSFGKLQMNGERRPLRVPLVGPEVQRQDAGILLSFSLPRGAYATAVLHEVMK